MTDELIVKLKVKTMLIYVLCNFVINQHHKIPDDVDSIVIQGITFKQKY